MDYWIISIFGLICAITTSKGTVFREEDGVLVLTLETFDKAVKEIDFLLVNFYDPGCGRCKTLAPEFVRAAQALRDAGSDARLAKVDAIEEVEIGERFEIRGFPFLKFFRNGKGSEYGGGRSADEIIDWMTKKSRPPAVNLETVDAAKKAIDRQEVAIVGFFKDQSCSGAKAYLEVASETMEDTKFLISSTQAVLDAYKYSEDSVTIFKKFDEARTDLKGDLNYVSIRDFMFANRLPLVTELNEDNAQKIFGGPIRAHTVLFISKNSKKFKEYVNMFKQAAKDFQGKILFLYVNIEESDSARILEFFNVKRGDCPAYLYINFLEDVKRYLPEPNEATISVQNVKNFVSEILDGKRKPTLNSEPLPRHWDSKPVKILVGKNFDQVARDKSKSVLVSFYAPWCGHCRQLSRVWDELGELYNGHPDVIIAKMDSTANELLDIRVQEFPTIKLFPKGSNGAIDYHGDKTVEGLKRFIDSGGLDSGPTHKDDEYDEHGHGTEDSSRDEL